MDHLHHIVLLVCCIVLNYGCRAPVKEDEVTKESNGIRESVNPGVTTVQSASTVPARVSASKPQSSGSTSISERDVPEPVLAIPGQVTSPICGVRLGETLSELRSRVSMEQSATQAADPDYPIVMWSVLAPDQQLFALAVFVFEGRVFHISMSFKDSGGVNYDVIKTELLQKYGGEKGVITSDLAGGLSIETFVDGVSVGIHLCRDLGIGDDDLTLHYRHNPLLQQISAEIQRRKAAKLKGKL